MTVHVPMTKYVTQNESINEDTPVRPDNIQTLLADVADQQRLLVEGVAMLQDILLPVLRDDLDVQESLGSMRAGSEREGDGMVYQFLQETIVQIKWLRNEIAGIIERVQL